MPFVLFGNICNTLTGVCSNPLSAHQGPKAMLHATSRGADEAVYLFRPGLQYPTPYV